jgi:NAD(P)-dependent dehydrogenase (short-subunit alcohol dehydrogenase family)
MTNTVQTAKRLLLILSVAFAPAVKAQSADTQKAVLVTGASSGIGRKITERLAVQGFYVYAGARAQKDLDQLGAIRNVQAVRLHPQRQPLRPVSHHESVRAASA